MAHWSDEYLQLIEDCENRSEKLSDWELGFIDSLGRQIEEGRMPTGLQIEKLDEIWNRVTSRK
jgi:hypothetical protein